MPSIKQAKARWQFQFVDSGKKHLGPLFIGARRNARGPWKKPEDVPQYVREYLNATGINDHWYYMSAKTIDQMKREIDEAGTGVKWHPTMQGLTGTVWIDMPVKKVKRVISPKVPAIRNLQDLCDHFSADEPCLLNKRIYKGTDCGASISVLPKNGKWLHNGADGWDKVKEITAFTIQTIVEGSDVEINSDTFELPVTVAEVEDWCEDMEKQASFYWQRDNSTYYVIANATDDVMRFRIEEWDDEPKDVWFIDTDTVEPQHIELAKKAVEAYWAPGKELDNSNGTRKVSIDVRIPIPGTEYTVREGETPNITY